jgi:hypothetical protein
MTQTAVEFLESQYKFHGELKKTDFEQANEMFEEQIIEAYNEAEGKIIGKGEQYYTETFKQQ